MEKRKALPRGRRAASTPSKPVPSRKRRSDRKQARELRLQVQLAMLKRALTAAEDDTLPHRAVCDFLRALTLLARSENLDSNARSESARSKKPQSNARNSAPLGFNAKRSDDMEDRLRETVRNIYGVTVSEPDANCPGPSADAGEA